MVEKVHGYVAAQFETKVEADDHVDAQPDHRRWRLVVREHREMASVVAHGVRAASS